MTCPPLSSKPRLLQNSTQFFKSALRPNKIDIYYNFIYNFDKFLARSAISYLLSEFCNSLI